MVTSGIDHWKEPCLGLWSCCNWSLCCQWSRIWDSIYGQIGIQGPYKSEQYELTIGIMVFYGLSSQGHDWVCSPALALVCVDIHGYCYYQWQWGDPPLTNFSPQESRSITLRRQNSRAGGMSVAEPSPGSWEQENHPVPSYRLQWRS